MLDDFEELKRQVAQAEREENELVGAKKQMLARLKSEFGVSTLAEAKKLFAKREESERRIAKKFAAKKKAFQEKFNKRLQAAEEDDS